MLASLLPIGIVARNDGLAPFGAGGQRALGVAIARQWIDHRPRHHHAAHGGILRRRAGRQRDRRIPRIVRPHGDQHGQMAAARLAGKADEVGPRLQLAGMRLGPAHRVIDVLHRSRIGVLVAGAEIERDRDDAVGRHVFVAQRFGQAVALAPGAAVAFDQSRKRPLPARLIHPRQQRLVAVAEIFDILDVEIGGFRFQGRGRHGRFLPCRLPHSRARRAGRQAWPKGLRGATLAACRSATTPPCPASSSMPAA